LAPVWRRMRVGVMEVKGGPIEEVGEKGTIYFDEFGGVGPGGCS